MGLNLGELGNSIKGAVSNVTQQATQWMNERADDVRNTISGGYQRIVDDAVDQLQEKSPEALKGVVGTLGHGYAKIGGKVLDYLDPVSYALETGADALDMMVHSPQRRIDAIKQMVQGDVGGGLTNIAKEFADETLLKGQIVAAVLPGGGVAAKAAKKPLKATRKVLKSELKQTAKGSAERKAVKHDLRVNSAKAHVAKPIARTSGIMAKQEAKAKIREGRQSLGIDKRKLHVSSRDWDSFARETDWLEPLNKPIEEGTQWTKQQQRRK